MVIRQCSSNLSGKAVLMYLHLPLRLWGWTGLFTISNTLRQFNKMIFTPPTDCILIQLSHTHTLNLSRSLIAIAHNLYPLCNASPDLSTGHLLTLKVLHIKDKVIKTTNQKLSSHKDSHLIRFVWPETNENMSLVKSKIFSQSWSLEQLEPWVWFVWGLLYNVGIVFI